MQSNRFVRAFAAVIASVVATISAWAYVLDTDESGIYVNKWQTSPVVMQLKLSATANLIDGNSQRSSVAAAMQIWNAQLGTLQFSPQLSAPGPYSTSNGINEIVMDSTVDGEAFPSGVLAITSIYGKGNATTETDIVFNTAYTWNSYRGNLRPNVEDIQRVALHELGHALGLNHPDEHNQFVTAIMNHRESNLDTLQSDDIAGGQKLYGAPGFRPANDDFENAATITLRNDSSLPADLSNSFSGSLSGSNIASTRENGEPNHADSTGGHSVWWQWTASNTGLATIETLGSNFDTVLAAYTGSAVTALTTVASNDDAESPDQNSTPQRKRTSKLTFNVVSGTTYYLAVDGWGSERTVLNGYTGSIAINFSFIVRVLPVFLSQPASRMVKAGEVVYFDAVANGIPTPTFRWQRLSVGGSWTDLSEGSDYTFTNTRSLQVSTTFAMDGDQYRCVATNLAGVTTSNAATLRVTPIPLPVIVAQPQSGSLSTGVPGTLGVQASSATGYQWFHNGVPVPGQTGANAIFADPQLTDAGIYYVVVSNPGGSITSGSATITVKVLPVVTNIGSVRQLVNVGQTLSVNVAATGTGNVSLQWYHNGYAIAGATNSSYSHPVTGAADAGAYWVTATDDIGTRYAAPFFVLPAQTATKVVNWGEIYGAYTGMPSGPTTVLTMSAGLQSALGVMLDGTVATWGNVQFAGRMPAELSNVVAVSVGWFSSIALKADGTVVATGDAANLPAGLRNVVAISTADSFSLALKTDGTVVSWGAAYGNPPSGLTDVVAIACGAVHALALKRNGTVVSWGYDVVMPQLKPPVGLDHVVSVAAGANYSLALKADGRVVGWGSNGFGIAIPAELENVVSISAGTSHALALRADATVVAWGAGGYGANIAPLGLKSVFSICAGGYSSFALRTISDDAFPVITHQPLNAATNAENGDVLTVGASGNPTPTIQWQRNGVDVPGATNSAFFLNAAQPSQAGIYVAIATSAGASVASYPVIAGILSKDKILGGGTEVGSNIFTVSNGNTFDQILLRGAAVTVTADPGQVTRISYVDFTNDIVQVEFSGAGSLSLVLDHASGPAIAEYYNQSTVAYMHGNAGIVIAGANETTNVSVFSVGRITAVDQTLFKDSVRYDGVADLAYIAILSTNDRFGGLRASNTNFFATKGSAGIYAPGVQFTAPVFVGDISASDDATPVLVLGSSTDTRITGGDLFQPNGLPVKISGISQLKFVAGTTSHGTILPAQANRARLEQNGADITAQVVVNPSP